MTATLPRTGWSTHKLGEFFQIKHGYAFKSEFFADDGPYVLLTPGNFRAEGGLQSRGEREKYFVGEFPDDFLLRRGDFLVVMTDLTQNAPILGSPAFIPEDNRYLHNQRLGKIVDLDEERLDKRFLYYLFNHYQTREQIKATATGATVRHTAPTRIYDIEARIPPLETQRQIADILSAYDDLIENNTRRIQILEEMARTIYREWFVHFRYPGHESVPLIDSPIGPVPEGWEVKRFSDAVEVRPSVKVPRDGIKPYIPMGSLSTDSMVIHPVEERTGNSGAKFQNGDTLMARITPSLENGKTGYVQFLPTADAAAFGSTEFIVLRSKSLCPEMVYSLARTDEVRSHAIKSMTGASGRQRVQGSCFNDFLLATPPSELVDQFQQIAQPIFRAIHRLSERSLVLTEVRDLLLPRLVTGQLHPWKESALCETDPSQRVHN